MVGVPSPEVLEERVRNMADQLEEIKQDLGARIDDLGSRMGHMEDAMMAELKEIKNALSADRINAAVEMQRVKGSVKGIERDLGGKVGMTNEKLGNHLQNHAAQVGLGKWVITTLIAVAAVVVSLVVAWYK